MGIIRAGISVIRRAAADQWKEAFCAPEMGSDEYSRVLQISANSDILQPMGMRLSQGYHILNCIWC